MIRLFVTIIACGFASSISAADPAAGMQVAQELKSTYAPSVTTRYQFFLPVEYGKTDQKWPLLVFLHGAGESGDDLDKVKIHGPPKLVEKQPGDFPFVVVSPQVLDDSVPLIDRWQPKFVAELVEHVAGHYAVDRDRIYLTGLSMGGFGTIRTLAAYPDLFAAGAPVCGGGWDHYAKALKDVPMWFFHGDNDIGVPVELSTGLVKAIRKQGGQPRLTIYENVGHDSWTQTYENPELYRWLLSHKLSDRPAKKK
ncbi:MAG: prolyl oligopeptidase family serine peptidase [Planctomycetaceae bacterium]|nr:prolyl oligopeptidase family serine peptidase [Planctomycetaceae bacterium]